MTIPHPGANLTAGFFGASLVLLALGLCSARYVKRERERMSSYIRYDRYLSNYEEDEDDALLYAGGELALQGRILEFRAKDYYSDHTLSAVTGFGCYVVLYELYMYDALRLFYWVLALHLSMVFVPLMLLTLSVYFPSKVPASLSFHIRYGYHAVVHHRVTERLNKCRGPFVTFNALVLVGFAIFSSSLDMVRYSPWRLTKFCVMSRGYPTWAAFKWLQGCHYLLLLLYAILQALLLLPPSLPSGSNVGIMNENHQHVHQSLKVPTREAMSEYVKGRSAVNDSPDFLSSGGLFGAYLLLLLLYRLGRVLAQHKRLLTRGRSWRRAAVETCVTLPTSMASGVCCRRHVVGPSSVRPASEDIDANIELTAVGHESVDIRYRYAEDDDEDYLEQPLSRVSSPLVSNGIRDDSLAARHHSGPPEEVDEEKGLTTPARLVNHRDRSIDEKLERVRGKRLIASRK